jgi:primosomal protein N' (replication factor Y)
MDSLAPLVHASEFHVALLRGVTGSGKTEVYLRLTEEAFTSGKRVLILVPEIALTRALALIFHRKFGERVAIQHSGLSEGERHDQWHRIRRGDIDVVVGTRSAVFAPLDVLGLIIVDEEHDPSFKQEESPRYHARDVAVVRGREAGALVVLGSATPSVETFFNVRSGRYRDVTMASRVYNRPLPKVRVVDMRKEVAAEGPDVVMSRVLREALATVLDRNEQALLLLNRRGFAASVLCRQCGRTLDCPNCSLALTFHRATNRARCHYCNYSVAGPKVCGNCAGPYLDTVGFGTERVEIEVSNHFSSASIARLDRDSAKRRGGISSVLDRFARGDVDVLIGTQMIAKGHDFRNVTLVGVISGDVGLTQPDFRAAERTFQLLTQVAGRAGRGKKSGEAIVQSFYPSHYSIGYACHQDYEPFFEEEIRFRAEMQYPPTVSMINAVVRGRSLSAAMTDAEKVARILRGRSGFRVLGPAPAPITRLRGQYRAQLFLKGRSRRTMRTALLEAVAERPELRRRMIIDVDPLSLL